MYPYLSKVVNVNLLYIGQQSTALHRVLRFDYISGQTTSLFAMTPLGSWAETTETS